MTKITTIYETAGLPPITYTYEHIGYLPIDEITDVVTRDYISNNLVHQDFDGSPFYIQNNYAIATRLDWNCMLDKGDNVDEKMVDAVNLIITRFRERKFTCPIVIDNTFISFIIAISIDTCKWDVMIRCRAMVSRDKMGELTLIRCDWCEKYHTRKTTHELWFRDERGRQQVCNKCWATKYSIEDRISST